jgi:hypothetical protein
MEAGEGCDMTCVEYWNRLSEGSLEASPGAGHLAECAACAERWKREQSLTAGLRLMSAGMHGEEAPLRVEAGLIAAFRAQTGFERRGTLARSWWMPALVWASAAAATGVLAVVLLHGSHPVPASVAPVSTPQRVVPPAVESASVPAEAPDDSAYGPDSDFIPVPNAARIEPTEDVNLVRFEITRSSLMALGIEVGEGSPSETVLADVVLGSDGMARAVRVVSNSDGTSLDEE